MIAFERPQEIEDRLAFVRQVAQGVMRENARRYDEQEHEIPWEFVNLMWETALKTGQSFRSGTPRPEGGSGVAAQALVHCIEMQSWGDAGIYLCGPGAGLGGAAVEATGTPEQKARFLARYREGKPKWASMAMTEAHCGSDTAAIRTTAVREGDHWVLNGEKIFVTSGHKSVVDSDGFMVVWATVDPSAGRAGMKPFVVEAGTPGLKITKLEHKMGIRASDTASAVLENCRIPLDNLLGSAEVKDPRKGFKGAMATFDATRPSVAASALGIARAALELLKEQLAAAGITIRYGTPRHLLTAIEREVVELEAQLRAGWLLTLKATWLLDQRQPNTVESSMCKVKAGDVVTRTTQKAVELMGPLGYSRRLLLEKWMRDAKINDLFEGTGQINRLVIARRILGYGSRELK
ncbi:MAG TPA: acyl-CoA dehydrogenase family protein [Vicinamibacteria bacterium]|nr:acyl-CoA dehydrogenase family protein [Vicinamibacteria bacterium]